jgi:geranylgeranyl diphosphate synthase type I
MIRLKTAVLLAASAEIGALVAIDDLRLTRSLYEYGQALGMSFQIQDDVLGIWGDEALTGKSSATDLRDKKKTLPVIYGLTHTKDPVAAAQLAAVYAQEGPLDGAAIEVALGLLDRLEARAYSEVMADKYYHQAVDSLEAVGPGGAAEALRGLAASLLGRSM